DRHPMNEEPHGKGESGRADAVSPGVAEARLAPAEVDWQKTEARAGQRQCQEREVLLTYPRTDEGKPTAGDDGPFGDEAVEPVDEIHRIDGRDAEDGKGQHVRDALGGEHRDGRAEQQREKDLADQPT